MYVWGGGDRHRDLGLLLGTEPNLGPWGIQTSGRWKYTPGHFLHNTPKASWTQARGSADYKGSDFTCI